jgi:hypothetical protein
VIYVLLGEEGFSLWDFKVKASLSGLLPFLACKVVLLGLLEAFDRALKQ